MVTTEFVGTLPQWITAVSSTSIAAAIVALVTAYWRRGISLRGLTNTDQADIRDHYAAELERVVERQKTAEERQQKCEEREHKLRERVIELENDVLGLIRIITQASADKVLQLGPEVSNDIRQMAERVMSRRQPSREGAK